MKILVLIKSSKNNFRVTFRRGRILGGFLLLLLALISSSIVTVLGQLQITPLNPVSFAGNDVDSKGILWAGDKNFNLYKSLDNGLTFTREYTLPGVKIPSNHYAGFVWNIFVDSRDTIFASAGGTAGLFRSTNGGASFSQVLKTNGTSNESFYISMTEDNLGNLYTVTYTNGGAAPYLLKSTDGGTNWFRQGNFNILHFHNIKFNPANCYLYVVLGEGPQADAAKIMRSSDGGASWTTVVKRNDVLGTVYLGMAFNGRYVYVGQDYPNRICQIHRFYDDGSNNIAEPQVVYTPPNDGYMPFMSATFFANNLIFANSAESVNGISRIVTSTDGLNWGVIKSQFLSYLTDDRWNVLTTHSRSNIIFGTIKPGESYKIMDVPVPAPTAKPTPTPTLTPTSTPIPSPSPAPTPSITPTPKPSPTPMPTTIPTATPTPTPTPDPTLEPTPATDPPWEPTVSTPELPTATTPPTALINTQTTPTLKPKPTATPSPTPTETLKPTTTPQDSLLTPSPIPLNPQNTSVQPYGYTEGMVVFLMVIGGTCTFAVIARKRSLRKQERL